MDSVLYAVVVVGSLCGFRAALRLGALAHRVALLEQRLALPYRAPEPSGLPLGAAEAVRALAPSFAPWAPVAAPVVDPGEPALAPAVGAAAMAPPPAVPAVPAALPVLPVPPVSPISPAVAPRPAGAPRSPEADWWHRFELQAGTRWVTWLGAGALVIAAALFVKLAIDRGWLGPAARLALGGAGGIALLLAGRRAHRAEMRPLAQGLVGAGLGVLYVATYVAFASYGLIARELVFAAMIGVTITGCAIALRHDAQPVAVLALLGGLLTPIAVSSGGGSRDALFAYLLVLDAGALAIAFVRRWAALELLALAGTWVLFGGWLARAHDAAARPAELAWLAAFHLMFVALPFGAQLRRRPAPGPSLPLFTAANTVAALVCATGILDGERRALGAVVLVMAVLYAALDAVARRRLPGARGELGLVALAAALVTLAVPLLLRDRAVTLAWSLEAPVLLALGFHDRRLALRIGALGVLGLALLHGVGVGWPGHTAGFRPFANPAFASAAIAPLAALLFARVHHALRRRGRGRGDALDHWHGTAALLVGSAALLALAHNDLERYFALAGRRDLGTAAVPLVWAIGSLLGLAAIARRPSQPAAIAVAAAAAALMAVGLCAAAYRAPGHPDALLALNLRFVAAAITAIAVAANAAVICRRAPEHARLAWAAALTGFGIVIGAEAFLHYAAVDPFAHAGRRAHTALSIAWSGYAAALLAFGFWRRRRPLRLAGLGLLGLVAVKLLLIDLAGAPQAYRVLSFLIVGALMIAVSYAYHRLERCPGPPEA